MKTFQAILYAVGAGVLAVLFAASLAVAVSTLSHAHGNGTKCHSHGTHMMHCH